MKRSDVIAHFGNITKACAAIGYSRHALFRWRKGIPLRTQLAIEQMTGGALKAAKRTSKIK